MRWWEREREGKQKQVLKDENGERQKQKKNR